MKINFFYLYAASMTLAYNITSDIRTPSTRDLAPSSGSSATKSTEGATEHNCCVLQPSGVMVGEWWNTTYTATVATVITQYIQYNASTETSSQTFSITKELGFSDWGMKTDVLSGDVYGGTRVVFGSTTSAQGLEQAITSPAAFYFVHAVYFRKGVLSLYTENEKSSETCSVQFMSTSRYKVSIYDIPIASEFIIGRSFVKFSPDFKRKVVSQIQGNWTYTVPIEECDIYPGEGAPVLHVPVSALTEHIFTTVTGQEKTEWQSRTPKTTHDDAKPIPRPTSLVVQTASQLSALTMTDLVPRPSKSGESMIIPHPDDKSLIASHSLVHESTNSMVVALSQRPEFSLSQSVAIQLQESMLSSLSTIGLGPNLPESNQNFPQESPDFPSTPLVIVIGTRSMSLLFPTNGPGLILPGDTTLAPGVILTYESRKLSLGNSEAEIFVLNSGSTSVIPLFGPTATDYGPVITVGSQVLSLGSSGAGTLVPSSDSTSIIPLFGSTVSENGLVTAVSVGSMQYTFTYATGTEGGIRLPDGATILPGSTTTIDGTVLYLAPSATEIVIGSTTIPLVPVTETADTGDGAGSYIWNGLGGGQATSRPAQVTGSGSREIVNCLQLVCCGVVGLAFQSIL